MSMQPPTKAPAPSGTVTSRGTWKETSTVERKVQVSVLPTEDPYTLMGRVRRGESLPPSYVANENIVGMEIVETTVTKLTRD